MQITQFRTSAHARHRTVGVLGKSPTMVGKVVEYARFVEVQQRRARVLAELLHRAPETPPATFGVAVDDQPTEGLFPSDASTMHGTVDVR